MQSPRWAEVKHMRCENTRRGGEAQEGEQSTRKNMIPKTGRRGMDPGGSESKTWAGCGAWAGVECVSFFQVLKQGHLEFPTKNFIPFEKLTLEHMPVTIRSHLLDTGIDGKCPNPLADFSMLTALNELLTPEKLERDSRYDRKPQQKDWDGFSDDQHPQPAAGAAVGVDFSKRPWVGVLHRWHLRIR